MEEIAPGLWHWTAAHERIRMDDPVVGDVSEALRAFAFDRR